MELYHLPKFGIVEKGSDCTGVDGVSVSIAPFVCISATLTEIGDPAATSATITNVGDDITMLPD